MPPVIVLALGAIGMAALAKLLANESRRVNGELQEVRQRSAPDGAGTAPRTTLERDPVTGDYRPRP